MSATVSVVVKLANVQMGPRVREDDEMVRATFSLVVNLANVQIDPRVREDDEMGCWLI